MIHGREFHFRRAFRVTNRKVPLPLFFLSNPFNKEQYSEYELLTGEAKHMICPPSTCEGLCIEQELNPCVAHEGGLGGKQELGSMNM